MEAEPEGAPVRVAGLHLGRKLRSKDQRDWKKQSCQRGLVDLGEGGAKGDVRS